MVQVCLKVHFNKEAKTDRTKIKISKDLSLLLEVFLLKAAHSSNALCKEERTYTFGRTVGCFPVAMLLIIIIKAKESRLKKLSSTINIFQC